MHRRTIAAALLAVLLCGLGGCGGGGSDIEDPELRQGMAFVRYLTSGRFLNRSSFGSGGDERTPSALVAYLFSDMGVSEWAVTGDPLEAEQMRSAGIPVPPPSVMLTRRRQAGQGRQLVLRGDDERGVVVVEGYGPEDPVPAFTEEIRFPR